MFAGKKIAQWCLWQPVEKEQPIETGIRDTYEVEWWIRLELEDGYLKLKKD